MKQDIIFEASTNDGEGGCYGDIYITGVSDFDGI